jgi:Icc protein
VTYSSLRSVLDHYQGSDWKADIAIVTGDIIQDDSAAAYGHFMDLMATLNIPVHCLPGNHDVRDLMRAALDKPPFHYCESIRNDGWLIVNLDSCVSGQAGGSVASEELDRMSREIGESDAEHVMVCLHHPPVEMDSRWLDSVGLDNRDDFMDRVAASGKVRLVIFGHVHQAYDAILDGIQILGTPSTCRQFAPKRALFAVDDQPPAYRRIQLHEDGNIDHQLVWLTE